MGFLSKLSEILGRKPTPAVTRCPLENGIVCIAVGRQDTPDTGLPNIRVVLNGPTPGSKSTDSAGIVEFDDCLPGPYQFDVEIPGPQYGAWKLAPGSTSTSASGGKVTIVDVLAYPTGTLAVEIRDDTGTLIDNYAALSTSGAASLSGQAQAGTQRFPAVACGEYTVAAEVSADLYESAGGRSGKVTVPEGGTATAKITVSRLNLVTPHIEVMEKESWFNPPAGGGGQAQPPPQGNNPPAESPARIRLSYSESRPDRPFRDGGTITFSGPDRAVFRDQGCKTPFALDASKSAKVSNADLSGLDLYVLGKAPGQATAMLVLDTPAVTAIRPVDSASGIVDLKENNAVTPKIEAEYKVVLLDPALSQYQDAKKADGKTDEKKILADDVTYIEVSAKARNESPKYTKGGKLEVTAGADKVKIYTDMRRTNLLNRPLTNRELFGQYPTVLYVTGAKEGEFKLKLTLDPSDDPHIAVEEMTEIEMSVVKLDIKLHQHDEAAIVNEDFDADKDTLDEYFTALNDKVIPDQKEMTDEQQVKPGRMLHVQKDGNNGRARLLVKKLTGHWPAGTDDYDIVLDETCESGGLALFDKETEGNKKDLPFKLKVKDLKAKDLELWVEGASPTKQWRDAVLDVGLDRDKGGLDKEAKRNGDWARFTLVQVKEVKLDYTAPNGKADAWDSLHNRFFINFQQDPDGRKIKIAVQLQEKLKDIPIHFMLAPHKDNGKTANWGKDLPATWKWKDIEETVKHKDRSDQKKLLHLMKKTDDQGKVDLELTLSRFGGDIFEPGVYITQDPHLAKYVKEHDDLGKRKPVVASHTIAVWRKFWYHEVKVEGLIVHGFDNAADTYEDVKAVMEPETAVEMPRATADGLNPPVIYPKHMISFYVDTNINDYVNNYPGDASDGLVVGDNNESAFMSRAPAAADKPVKIPMVNAHALWIGSTVSGDEDTGMVDLSTNPLPIPVRFDKELLDPPLQGGTLLNAGSWEAADWDPAANGGAGDWVNYQSGVVAPGDISLDANRSDPNMAQIAGLTGLTVSATTWVRVYDLSVNGGQSFLGTSYGDGIVNAFTPNDVQDFINTITHELGHSFKQVAKVLPAGVPAHPLQYDKDGSHCNYQNKSCLMYESGPQAIHLDRFCEVCHPYVLVQDMSTV